MVTFAAATPALPSRDVAKSIEFYRDVLGFEVAHREGEFAVLRRDNVLLNLWGATDEAWHERLDPERPVCSGAESFIAGTASCRIEVRGGVDALYESCRAHDVVHPKAHIEDQWWGTREFAGLDPDGNLVSLYENRA